MSKTQEIYEWYKHSMERGSLCCKTDNFYLMNYPIQYNEAVYMYKREKMDSMFPELGRLSFPYVK